MLWDYCKYPFAILYLFPSLGLDHLIGDSSRTLFSLLTEILIEHIKEHDQMGINREARARITCSTSAY